MPSLQTFILAFSLSGDAFAASLAKGARYNAMPLWRTFFIALGFGTLEALAPVIGFMLGLQFADTIAAVDHWIAFILLFLIGARMIYRGFFPVAREDDDVSPTWATVATTAIGTSIDATVVGVTLALVTNDISTTVITIGVVTFVMTFIGLRVGSALGLWAGRSAEALGGLGLVAIGAHILFTHMSAG